jgi:diadenosine tetraphosphate (Ap4A) HIT family hydrolase
MSSIFSKIIAGEIPSYKIYEDDKTIAFLTIRPHTEGHTLVVPKIEVDHWDDVPEEYFGHMWRAAQFVSKMLKSKLQCTRIGVMVVGFEVPHAHIHLIPSDSMDDLSIGKAHDVTPEELAATHVKLTS